MLKQLFKMEVLIYYHVITIERLVSPLKITVNNLTNINAY